MFRSMRNRTAFTVMELIEINAVTEDAPAPHSGKYNVLYADLKKVKSQEEIPEDLRKEIEKKRKEAEEQKKEKKKK